MLGYYAWTRMISYVLNLIFLHLGDSFHTWFTPAPTRCAIKPCWLPRSKSLITPLMTTTQPSCTATAGQDAEPSNHSLASTIFSLFSSSGPAGDWLKLFVIGGILELLRRFFMFIWRNMVNQFWITIALEEYNDSYCECRLIQHPLPKPNDSKLG